MVRPGTVAAPLDEAMATSRAAQWRRVALQVNPYSYVGSHRPSQHFPNEASYNAALIDACLELEIEMIGITDHWCVAGSLALEQSANEAGIVALPGFEAVSDVGIHVLMLFDQGTQHSFIDAAIGACGGTPGGESGTTGKGLFEIFEVAADRGALAIPAHATGPKGLLSMLMGQGLATAWRSPRLQAIVVQAGESMSALQRRILDNKALEYQREQPVAELYADDVCHPDDLGKPGGTSWVKMSRPSREALDLATRTPATRVRRDDPLVAGHPVIRAIAWEGGFLDGVRVQLSESLTCLVGGRGTGKSTVVESIRYALNLRPIGESARSDHRDLVGKVLKDATKVSLLVETAGLGSDRFTIERSVPDPPVVRDAAGTVLASTPSDVMGPVEIFSQHELAELADSGGYVATLLQRFFSANDPARGSDTQALRQNREAILALLEQRIETQELLDALPRQQEALSRFQQAGLDRRLVDQAALQREEGIFEDAASRLDDFAEVLTPLADAGLLDRAFVSDAAVRNLPRQQLIQEIDFLLADLGQRCAELVDQLSEVLEASRGRLADARLRWEQAVAEVRQGYQETLRSLQREGLDGSWYLATERAVERLVPMRHLLTQQDGQLESLWHNRRQLLAEHRETRTAAERRLGQACTVANEALRGVVRVKPERSSDRRAIEALIHKHVAGQRTQIIHAIRSDDFSPAALVQAARTGIDSLASFGIRGSQALNLAAAGEELFLSLEETSVDLAAVASLNVAVEGGSDFRPLPELSKGQKATALLLLLLTASAAPLVIDQPEDDLDNRFIWEGVVPRLRDLKEGRQLIFSTHNANIPVLGDAELMVVLQAPHNRGQIADGGLGSLDDPEVRRLAEAILEGGKDAFNRRRYLYGF